MTEITWCLEDLCCHNANGFCTFEYLRINPGGRCAYFKYMCEEEDIP